METGGIENIKNFDQLLPFLRDELDWPLDEDYDFEDFVYDYDPGELGLKPDETAKIREIHQLRPLNTDQSWGIFFISFEEKKIPVGVLKRILGGLTLKKRQSANKADQKGWDRNDLLFISAFGQSGERELSFLHFSEENNGKKKIVLKELGWDKRDTKTKQVYVYNTLKNHLSWPDDSEGFKEWINAFTIGHGEAINTTKLLTKRLAELASGIREAASEVLSAEKSSGPLTKIFNDFKKTIFHNLTKDDFADMYAQTICYGLLSVQIARTQKGLATNTLSADDAALEDMQVMQPFLKDLMESFLAVGGRKSHMDFNELGVNEVVELLQAANMKAVVLDFGNRNPNEDPILHFYEHFLKDYDGLMRKNRGVYYTPLPVVSFIVRSVDEILQKEFGLEDGLADTTTWGEMHKKNPEINIPEGVSEDAPFVQILDPATGTGTFLVETIGLIEKRMKDKWHKAGKKEPEIKTLWNDYVPKHLLPRLNGFELMMAPYAIAHIKIGMKLAETGYEPKEGEQQRVRVYLTNTLDEPIGTNGQSEMSFITESLALEAKGADQIKAKTPITVVIGNPPYSGHSANPSKIGNKMTFIGNLIRPYFEVDGQAMNERNAKWVNNDYVKFLRYSQWRLENSGSGILGYITSNSYIDSPTFRGVRNALFCTFSNLNILNLHGSLDKNETAPDGSKDENVFDISEGVSICLFRTGQAKKNIKHQHLYGRRPKKIQWLAQAILSTIKWTELKPNPPEYFFVPIDNTLKAEYQNGFSVNMLFPVSSVGIVTARDKLTVHMTEQKLHDTIDRFVSLSPEQARTEFDLGDDVRDWKIHLAQQDLRENPDREKHTTDILYRPFDTRKTYYTSKTKGFLCMPRPEVMSHMLAGTNVGMITVRQQSQQGQTWCHIGATTNVIEGCAISNKTREINYLLPLYLHPLGTETEIRPNLSNSFAKGIISHTGLNYESRVTEKQTDMGRGDLAKNFGPRDVFDYIYAVLHSPAYRTRYADFLKSDFPRIPLPGSADIFRALVALGRQLVALHLLDEKQAPNLAKPETRFVGKGEARVEKGFPKYENGKVMINPACHFEDVTSDVWDFHIGGYQVCHKWLKDRAGKGGQNPHPGRILSEDDILHYRRITIALRDTISLMKQIDDTIHKHGGWPDAFYVAPPPPATIEEIIQADESHELEYKSTFQWDVKENRRNKDLQKPCLKTIAAFLNTKGGTLVIGVTDDKEIFGLEQDLKLTKGTTDQFEQTFRQAMDNCIGPAFAPYCKIRFAYAPDGKQVCVIEVEKGKEPAFLKFQNQQDFFIRNGNATKALTASEQHDYIRQHFDR